MTNEEAIAELREDLDAAEYSARHAPECPTWERSAAAYRLAIAALEAARWRSMETAPRGWEPSIDVAFRTPRMESAGTIETRWCGADSWIGRDGYASEGAEGWLVNDELGSCIHPDDCLGWRPRPDPPKDRIA